MVAQLDSQFIKIAPERALSRLVGYTLFEGRPATTVGRWWNPVVFANLRLAGNQPKRDVDRPIFIVGMGRSGTTLLGRILAAHPDVGFLNEPKAMWHLVRDDDDIIGSYAPLSTGRLYLDAADADPATIDHCRALFSWYLFLSHSRRAVDKYPEMVFRSTFLRQIFPDAFFLVAVRSPWSTLKSVSGWSKVHGSKDADWWGVNDQKWQVLCSQAVAGAHAHADLADLDLAGEDDHHVRAAVEWIVTMRQSLALLETDPLAKLVMYEELVSRPSAMVADILRFGELGPSRRTEEYASEVVSAEDRSAEIRAETEGRLPDPVVAALDDTWARLSAAR